MFLLNWCQYLFLLSFAFLISGCMTYCKCNTESKPIQQPFIANLPPMKIQPKISPNYTIRQTLNIDPLSQEQEEYENSKKSYNELQKLYKRGDE